MKSFLAFVLLFFHLLSYSQDKVLQFGHSGWISTFKVSHDELSLGTGGSNDGQVILWDINLRKVKSKYQTYGNRIDDIAFNPNNKQIAAIDGQGNIFVWNTETNELVHQFQPGDYGPIVYNSDSETSKYFSPNKSETIGGGVLLFTEDTLFVGMGFPRSGFQSSLFKIDLNSKGINALDNMPKNDYNEFIGIGFIKQIDKQNAVLQIGKFSDKTSVVLYNLIEGKIERSFIKNKSDIESIAVSEDKRRIAISLDENYDPITYIFDITNGKKLDKAPYGGELTWQENGLWMGGTDDIRYYDTDKKEFQNYFEAGRYGVVNHLQYLQKHKKLLINYGKNTFLIEPLKLNLIASTKRWLSKNSSERIITSEFLDNKNVLIQCFNYNSSKSYTHYEKYIWNVETNTTTEILPHKITSPIQGVKNNLIYGFDLDSTKVPVTFFDETEYQDASTFDFYKFNDGRFELEESFENRNILKINENDQSMFLYDSSKNLHLVNYKTKDTLKTLYNQYTDLRSIKVYYDKSSGIIAVYNDNYPEEDTLKFYRISEDSNIPFYEYKSDNLEILGYDGKKRILTNSDSYEERIINIANPERFTIVDDNFGEIVCFHPSEPWIFYIKKYSSNSVVCYDYNKGVTVGGFTINNDDDYYAQISNLSLNAKGDKLLAWLEDNQLFAISVNEFTDIKTITEYNQPVDQISDSGNYLSLNASIINLSNLQVEKKFNRSSFTKVFKNYALNFYITDNGYNEDTPNYLIKTRYFFNNQKVKTDSLDISKIGISRYYQPIYLASNKYLFFTKPGDRYNPGLIIVDLEKNKILFNEPELYYNQNFIDADSSITFSSSNFYYFWEKGSNKLQKKDISSKNLYLFRPESGVVNIGNDQILKSELDALIKYDLKNKISNDTILIPERYSRVTLLTKTNDSLIWSTVFSKNQKMFGLSAFDPKTTKWGDFIALKSRPTRVTLTNSKDYLIVVLSNGEVQLRNPYNASLLVSMYQDSNNEVITVNEEGFYASSDANKVSFLREIKGELFYDKLLDIEKNRPDKVLKSIGKTTPSALKLYKKASELRRKFYDIKDDAQVNSSNELLNIDYPQQNLVTDSNKVDLKLKNGNTSSRLTKLINGRTLKSSNEKNKSLNDLQLSYGENHIQIFANNSTLGKEIKVTSRLKEANNNLIICTISVSKYQDSIYDLKYAVKDGQDLINAFKKQSDAYDAVKTFELYDSNVTKENIEQVFQNMKTNLNDKIIVFLSGHGLLDSNNDFYFATHDIDFENPRARGMGLNQLQQLLSNLNTQKKLLFIDACYSGLVDDSDNDIEEETEVIKNNSTVIKKQSFKTKGAIGSSTKSKNSTTTTSAFELMQNVYSSFSSSTGLETITAASGNSVALESSRWQNGSFTYAIKLGLLDYEADLNANGIITVNELKSYVLKTVPEITNGAQKPTSRETNKYLNWDLWY